MKSPATALVEFNARLDGIADKKSRVREIIDFSTIYGDNYGSRIIPLLEEGIRLSKEVDDQAGAILCYCHLGFLSRVTGQDKLGKYAISLQELTRMVEGIKEDPEMYAFGLNLLSYYHWFRGEFEKAFNLGFESLKIDDRNAVSGKAWNNFGIAVFYFDTKDFENCRKHYQNALDTFKELNHEYGIARASNGLGTVSIVQNRIEEAAPLLEYAAAIYRSMGHFSGLSRAINDLGLLEKSRGNYKKAVAYLGESIVLRKEIEHFQGLVTSYTELGETYLLMNDYSNALDQLQSGLALAEEIGSQQKQMRLHKLLYDIFKKQQNTELALYHFEKFFDVKSQILSDEAANNIKKVQTQFEREKSEREAELQRFINVELKKANTIIEQKNKDITDSINYARRIQTGILPSKAALDQCLDNYFVLYRPKDIVSGDFYWAAKITDHLERSPLCMIAAIDCTGHGVPGAFMSMLGYTLLNHMVAINETYKAADVLNFLNEKLPENLRSSDDQHIRDGMDMGLCIFDLKKMQMQFAGANNPCWIIRNGELIQLKGDKQAISASNEQIRLGFTTQFFDLKTNDHVYLFTDGFPDQFGGPGEKKFGYKRFKETLLNNVEKPMDQQKEDLLKAFEEWKGDLEQVDDVCVIGIKIRAEK